MAKLYRSREGEATAVDTKTQLTTLGSETAPGALLVPKNATKLMAVIVAAAAQIAAAGSCSAFIRLEGSGLPRGPEVLAIMATGCNVATGSQEVMESKCIELDVDVTPGQEILIFGEMAGVDVTQVSFGVTLVFSA